MQIYALPSLMGAMANFSFCGCPRLRPLLGQHHAKQQALGADKDSSTWQQAIIAGGRQLSWPWLQDSDAKMNTSAAIYLQALQVLVGHLHVNCIKQSATCNTWQAHASMYSTSAHATCDCLHTVLTLISTSKMVT